MINTKHLLKVTSIWISAVYVICYVGVAIYPPMRTVFVRYALHADVALMPEFLGAGYFISGLVIWNVAAVAAVWSFAALFNRCK